MEAGTGLTETSFHMAAGGNMLMCVLNRLTIPARQNDSIGLGCGTNAVSGIWKYTSHFACSAVHSRLHSDNKYANTGTWLYKKRARVTSRKLHRILFSSSTTSTSPTPCTKMFAFIPALLAAAAVVSASPALPARSDYQIDVSYPTSTTHWFSGTQNHVDWCAHP